MAAEDHLGGEPAPAAARSRGRISARSTDRLWRWFFCGPVLVGASIFFGLPVFLAVILSLFQWPTSGGERFIGLRNFGELLAPSDSQTWIAIRNTVSFGASNVILVIAVGLLLATWINTRPRGWRVIRVIFFIPVLTPLVADSLVWSAIYNPGTGLLAGIWGALGGSTNINVTASAATALASVVVMSVWHNVGYNVLLFSAALEAVPTSVLDAAKVDGADGLRKFLRMTLPMISPTVFFAGVLSVIGSLQVFARVFILTDGGPGLSSTTLGLEIYNTAFTSGELGSASALAIILVVILLAVTGALFRLQRRYVYYEVDPEAFRVRGF